MTTVNASSASNTQLPVGQSLARTAARHNGAHYRRPVERPFFESQRADTTVLFGGLSPRHDRLMEGVLKGLGYRATALPSVSLAGYERAREYGNNGLCNPTYFTVGNLVKYVQDLEASGLSREDIVARHVFVTAGSCGTCRFGMYESEYRLALRNAGFDGFRVIVFGTDDGIDQSTGQKAGFEADLDFFLAVINAFNAADIVNQFLHTLRPYEVEEGAVDRVTERVLTRLASFFEHRPAFELSDSWARGFMGTRVEKDARFVGKIISNLMRKDLVDEMTTAAATYDEVELDPFRVKPVVKFMGEFWAQVTEGPGNFHMHRFLEKEGAEVSVDRFLFTRLTYLLHMHKEAARDRRELHGLKGRDRLRVDKFLGHYFRYYRKRATFTLAERILRRENERLLRAMGGTLHPMVSQYELARLAEPYWNWRTCSGESHLEIAENIYYHTHHLCHMVLSVKPFTCMPSTQSDGVQAKVVEQFPGMIFLPIETSGEGEVIAHSRVQMALGAARARARKEWSEALARTGRSFAADHPEIKRPTYRVPHHPGVVGRAANFALHVKDLMAERPARVFPGRGTVL
jgi:predicted nucleotide-binding protein (sugar kinase/HSP70/actin superfamily)